MAQEVGSILYFFMHHFNVSPTKNVFPSFQMISTMANKVTDLNNVKIMKEFLLGACYTAVSRHITSDSMDVLRSLPLTIVHSGSVNENVSQCYVLY